MKTPFAKKSFGQHFLKDQHVLERIAKIVENLDPANLVEVGPGMGALTKHLLVLNKKLLCIEADYDMQQYLLKEGILDANQLIAQDVLKVHLDQLFHGEPLILCGNFPYNISSQILIQTLLSADCIPYMVGMFQKEVAQRITASASTSEYGTISVLTQLLYDPDRCFDIAPGAFVPPPKVTSSVILLRRKKEWITNPMFRGIQKLVRHAFQYRRKTLRNNLRTYLKKHEVLADPYFDLRAEALTPDDFKNLYLRLQPHCE